METAASWSGEPRSSPSVSPEKWAHYAVSKLVKGYFLVVNTERRSANFFKPHKGYEPCAYKIARKLIEEGIVKMDHANEDRHFYILSQVPLPPPVKPASHYDDDDDVEDDSAETLPTPAIDDLLDQIVDDSDEEETEGEDDDLEL